MNEHEFTLVLTAEPNEEEADKLYGLFDDGTLYTIAGVAQIDFHRAALSLEEAICGAITNVTTTGFDVARVEIDPHIVMKRVSAMPVYAH